MYKPVDPKVDFPKTEEKILQFWEDKDIFKKSIDQRDDNEEFVFYDGPPFATGLPHFGHFVPGTIKDIIPRYQTMKGKKVERRFGWDCHGLPVEYEMEKELGISGKKEIEAYGVAEFNESCRSIVLRYTREWKTVINRLGRWVDFENDYKTMEPDYMESIWWVVKRLWEKNLLFEGHYILPYCPRCSTVLSNHELNLGGYKEIHDPAITVKFTLKGNDHTHFLAWTTTPWTLPSNLALAVGPDIDYVKVKDGEEYYILAEERIGDYYKSAEEYEIVEKFKGESLKGIDYEPLFPYFSEFSAAGAFKIYTADYVSTDEGSGIVHTAPGFGEDDYNTLKDTDIPTICPLDPEGQFTEEVTDFAGMYVKTADKEIIRVLKDNGKLVKRENYLHSYPHCWRCKAPLIYRAIGSWFVSIDKIKENMLKANNQIHWVPGHLQEGRFGKWLEGARDWAISRNRYWGNPIPIWKCDTCEEIRCIGSRKELQELSGIWLEDLHKHYVDKVTFPCGCGGTMTRVPEVLDCWFESGAMPYAQNHYPFEHKEHFENHYPADFISEGLDQTRGWFYTLTILAAALFDKPAAMNIVVNGLVLAEDGKKMSKSERNYSDPKEVMDKFGADALRLFLMNSPVVKAEDLRYSDDGVMEVLKSVIIPLWNAYSFFVTYANIDSVMPRTSPENPQNPLDRWILSEAERLISDVTQWMDEYDLQKAIEPMVSFIDSLNNWYIRRSRRRFWRSENDLDKEQAYQTLYGVILALIKVAAPVLPFITEEIFQNLRDESMPESIHLCNYPVADEKRRDPELELKMSITRQAVSMGRAIRSMYSIKIRQPLKAIYLVTLDQQEKKVLKEMEEIIKEELNVKEVIYRENEEDLVEYKAKANFRVLGKELGKDMKAAAKRIEDLQPAEIQSIMEGATLSIDLGNRSLDITAESIVVQRFEKANLKVLNEKSLTLALDSEITRELKKEGLIRDIVRSVQNLRKDRGLDVTDRIVLFLHGDDEVEDALEEFEEYLSNETLAVKVEWEESDDSREIECGETRAFIDIRRA